MSKVYFLWALKYKEEELRETNNLYATEEEAEAEIRKWELEGFKPVKVYISETDPRKAKG